MAPACEFDRLFTTNVLHIHEKIFLSLGCISFMNCLEVSRSWNDLLTSESFTIKGKALFSEDIRMELRFAARSGQTDMVRRMLSSGMVSRDEMNNSTARRASPLLLATVYGHRDVVKLLLNGGANPNKDDAKLQSTPLYEASKLGRLDLVKLLLDRGAKIDIKLPFKKYNLSNSCIDPDAMENGVTPLQVAAGQGHKDVVQHLLKRGADPDMADHFGNTALSLALEYRETDIVNILEEFREFRDRCTGERKKVGKSC